jgi:hypothetical protein
MTCGVSGTQVTSIFSDGIQVIGPKKKANPRGKSSKEHEITLSQVTKCF